MPTWPTAKYRVDAPVRIMPGDKVIIAGAYWHDNQPKVMRCAAINQKGLDVCSEESWVKYRDGDADRLYALQVAWKYVDYKAMGYDE